MNQQRVISMTLRAALGAALLVAALSGCGKQAATEPVDTAVTVETAEAKTGDLSTDGIYIGTISAEGTAQVITLVSGTVDEIAVSVGDSVQAGDLLCRIDDESARLALQNARAAYQTALSGVGTAEAAVRGAESQYQSALESYGGEPWDETRSLSVLEEQVRLARENYDNMPLGQALVEAGTTRLRPILMTTLTTAISMLPMIFSSNSGMSMMKDMAYIVIGGLIASTVLALFLMPAFYLLIRGERIEA